MVQGLASAGHTYMSKERNRFYLSEIFDIFISSEDFRDNIAYTIRTLKMPKKGKL